MAAQITITIGLPREVWERCKARVGAGKSNSEVGRTVVTQWLEYQESAVSQAHADAAEASAPGDLQAEYEQSQPFADREKRVPQVLKWERGV